MNEKRAARVSSLILGLGMILSSTAACAFAAPPPQVTPEQEEIERFLTDARVLSKPQPAEKGRNDPWVVLLGDGKTTHRAVFKYIDRHTPPALTASYRHELAAYALSKVLGVDVIPPVVARRIENIPGSLQIMVEGCITELDRQKRYLSPPDPQAYADRIAEIRVLEHLTYCDRTDLGDLLVHPDTWKVCRVDFAEAFMAKTELLSEADIRRCSKRLYAGLRSVPDKAIEQAVRRNLEKPEIDALLVRRRLILDRIDALIKEKGENAVLFEVGNK